jgi:hypothetical protein
MATVPARIPASLLARAALFLWTLPTNAVGHLAGLAGSGHLPARVGASAVRGWAYELRWSGIGAVTIGDVVLHDKRFFDGLRGRILLAHELAHVAQHRVLGPFYLVAHAFAQAASAVRGLGQGLRFVDLVHAHNPLEQKWICLGFDECAEVAGMAEASREALLRQYGV